MGKRKTGRRDRSSNSAASGRRRSSNEPSQRAGGLRTGDVPSEPASLPDRLLHLQTAEEQRWKYLPHILALAFVLRAAIALSGDFVLHPDEIMQYLEQAHRLAFGNGVIYWEYFYGARSWLVPGAIAGLLKLFDIVGAGQPAWYVAGVKLAFCAVSLAIPAGMYCFARRHFGERSARAALLAGAFWYELAGFAHKPMTEFVATALLMALLAIAVRPNPDDGRTVWQAALLAVLAAAIRIQYAVPAAALMTLLFVRTTKRLHLVLGAAIAAIAIGVFDALTWGGGLFHSYITNIQFNLIVGEVRVGESPAYQYLTWLALAGGGLSVLAAVTAGVRPRRYGFLLALAALVLAVHSLQPHKEYRFVFAVVPIWLLLAADIGARLSRAHKGLRHAAVPASLFVAISLTGLANALPGQASVYKAWSGETGMIGFWGGRDPVFATYRYLAGSPEVKGVWQTDRPYFNLPGYYYLHRDVPLYDLSTIRAIGSQMEGGQEVVSFAGIRAAVSHIVTGDPDIVVPGYSLEREFDGIRVMRRDENGGEVRRWEARTPTVIDDFMEEVNQRIAPDAPAPPENDGIRFLVRDSPSEIAQ